MKLIKWKLKVFRNQLIRKIKVALLEVFFFFDVLHWYLKSVFLQTIQHEKYDALQTFSELTHIIKLYSVVRTIVISPHHRLCFRYLNNTKSWWNLEGGNQCLNRSNVPWFNEQTTGMNHLCRCRYFQSAPEAARWLITQMIPHCQWEMGRRAGRMGGGRGEEA